MSRIGHRGENTFPRHLKVRGNYCSHSSRANSSIDLPASPRPPKAGQAQHDTFLRFPKKEFSVCGLVATTAHRLLLMGDILREIHSLEVLPGKDRWSYSHDLFICAQTALTVELLSFATDDEKGGGRPCLDNLWTVLIEYVDKMEGMSDRTKR